MRLGIAKRLYYNGAGVSKLIDITTMESGIAKRRYYSEIGDSKETLLQ